MPRADRRRVRVLLAISSLHHGGAERQLAELVRGMDRARYEPRLALCDPTDQFGYDLDAGPVTSLDSPDGATLLTFYRIVRLVRELEPDIVHGFGGLLNIYCRMATRVTGHGRSVTSVRNGSPPVRDLVHERLTWPLTDIHLANSVGIRDILVERSRIPAGHIEVIENGVDSAQFRPLTGDAREEARRRWSMRGLALVLPARMSEEKNHMGVIEALGALKAARALPDDFEVLFTGRVFSDAHDRALKGRIRALGVDANVRVTGVVRDMASLLGASDGVILPSRYEGMPNVVLEGMACGVPVIVSPPANLDHIVRDGQEGFVLRGTAPLDVMAGLARLLSASPDERRALGERGRARAVGDYSLARMVARTCAVYERLLASG